MSIIIKKARLKGSRLNLDYEQPVVNGKDVISAKCANKVHPDLVTAFEKLIPHMILLCELPESDDLIDRLINRDINDCTEGFPKIEVTGFSIGGDSDEAGVTIIGSRMIGNNGKTLNLISPFQKYDEEEYGYAGQLKIAVDLIVTEITQFLDGKVAEVQLDLFQASTESGDDPFAQGAEIEGMEEHEQAAEGAQITEPAKRGRKKKNLEPAA